MGFVGSAAATQLDCMSCIGLHAGIMFREGGPPSVSLLFVLRLSIISRGCHGRWFVPRTVPSIASTTFDDSPILL